MFNYAQMTRTQPECIYYFLFTKKMLFITHIYVDKPKNPLKTVIAFFFFLPCALPSGKIRLWV